jgi:hypothetical protein
MEDTEVCTPNVNIANDTLQWLLKPANFKAGRLQHYLPQWSDLSHDPSILDIVRGVKIEMVDNDIVYPNARPSVFQ